VAGAGPGRAAEELAKMRSGEGSREIMGGEGERRGEVGAEGNRGRRGRQ
jgi:hypothetical protein